MPKWLICAILTMLFFGCWGVVPRVPEIVSVSPAQTQVVSTLGLLPIILALAFTKGVRAGSRHKVGILCAFVSGVLTGLGNLGLLKAMNEASSVSGIIPLTSLYPVVTVVLALAFLREKIHWVQTVGIFLALAAIYPLALYSYGMSGQEKVMFVWTALIPFGLWGAAGLFQKLATNRISSEMSTLWFLLAFLPIALFLWKTQPMDWALSRNAWFYLILYGALLGVGNVTLLAAFGSGGKAAVVTPISGLYAIVTVPLAILLLGERVTGLTWVGIGLALLGIVALSYEKKPKASPGTAVFPTGVRNE
jgi:uncharacterized membrane protein